MNSKTYNNSAPQCFRWGKCGENPFNEKSLKNFFQVFSDFLRFKKVPRAEIEGIKQY